MESPSSAPSANNMSEIMESFQRLQDQRVYLVIMKSRLICLCRKKRLLSTWSTSKVNMLVLKLILDTRHVCCVSKPKPKNTLPERYTVPIFFFLTFHYRKLKRKVWTTIVYKRSTGPPRKLLNGKPKRKNAKPVLTKVSLITINSLSVNTIDSPPPSILNRFKASNRTVKKPKLTWPPMLISNWPPEPNSPSVVISPETRMSLLSTSATIVSIKKLLERTTNTPKKPKRAWNAVLPCKLEC